MHFYILSPKLLQWNFLQISQLSIIFERNFAKIVALPSNENENYVVLLKEQSILKKC